MHLVEDAQAWDHWAFNLGYLFVRMLFFHDGIYIFGKHGIEEPRAQILARIE